MDSEVVGMVPTALRQPPRQAPHQPPAPLQHPHIPSLYTLPQGVHPELQEPGYHHDDSLHLPFQTGPLPYEGLEGEVPYEGLFPQGVGGGGVNVDVESRDALPAGLSESKREATAAPRLDLLEKSSNSRNLLSGAAAQRQVGGQVTSSGAERGKGGGGGAAAGDDPDNAPAETSSADGVKPVLKSSSLTKKVFAPTRADGDSSGSGPRPFAAASAAGTVFSGGEGDDRASPENSSPTSNATSTDAAPARNLGETRRHGGSSLKKVFPCGPRSQSVSPSTQALRKEDGRNGSSSKSLLSAPPPVEKVVTSTTPGRLGGGTPPVSWSGGASVGSAAPVMPRIVGGNPGSGGGVSGGGGDAPATTQAGSWLGKKGPGRTVVPRRESGTEPGGVGAEPKEKAEIRFEEEAHSSNVGDFKEELVPAPPSK